MPIVITALSAVALAGGLGDIDHVVLFMQENRAFDHYYGTLAGVRGFKDPNVLQGPYSKPIWYQPTGKTGNSSYLLPWYLSEDQDYAESNQCSTGGTNGWDSNHNSWNFGAIDGWVTNNTAWSWGSYRRSDIPTHFSIVEGWTIADMYAESVIGPTNPNRVTWTSGTINLPGSPPGDPTTLGGPYIENYETPGCQHSNGYSYACYPLKWKTVPEYLEEAGIDWFVFQDTNNFDDNPFAWFQQYQDSKEGSSLHDKGISYAGLDAFYDRAANGTLPAVSYIIGPMELSEHPPYRPSDGAWLQQKVVEAVVNSPKYSNTALLISYDETGGYGDHVPPFVSPNGTSGEWFTDPEAPQNYVPSGPGFRVPFYVISPWTRGGKVYTAPTDHNSQILFLEEWANAKGKSFHTNEMNQWRRDNMDNLVDIFDFENPDYSKPSLVDAADPPTSQGKYTGTSTCQQKWNSRKPPVPYGNQNEADALWTEEGYKKILGALTEGRYLALQDADSSESCLTSSDCSLASQECVDSFYDSSQWFIVHQVGNVFSTQFKLESANGGYVTTSGLTNNIDSATVFDIEYNSNTYTVKTSEGNYLQLVGNNVEFGSSSFSFNIYSVTYNS